MSSLFKGMFFGLLDFGQRVAVFYQVELLAILADFVTLGHLKYLLA